MKYVPKIILLALLHCSISLAEDFDFDSISLDDLDHATEAVTKMDGMDVPFLENAFNQIKNGTLSNLEIRDQRGNTPLMWAVAFRNFDALDYLLNHNADVEATNDEGATPFAWLGLGYMLMIDYHENSNTLDLFTIVLMLIEHHMDLNKPIPYFKKHADIEVNALSIILAPLASSHINTTNEMPFINFLISHLNSYQSFLSKYKIKISEENIASAIKFCEQFLNYSSLNKEYSLQILHQLKCFVEGNHKCAISCPIN